MIWWALAAWVVAVNGLAFVAFGVDKRRAVRGDWRLSEAYLLMLAAVGGWVGAKAGQRWFRHKTRKEPFRSTLNSILVVPLLGLLVLTTPVLPMVAGLLGPLFTRLAQDTRPVPERPFPRRFGPGSGD